MATSDFHEVTQYVKQNKKPSASRQTNSQRQYAQSGKAFLQQLGPLTGIGES